MFMWNGWFQTLNVFYIEHIISNFNWFAYFMGVNVFTAIALLDGGTAEWLTLVGYFFASVIFFNVEHNSGTDAIRYFDNSYYADEKLNPSLLYIFGILKHEPTPEEFVFEAGDDQADDIPIENFRSVVSV